MDSQKVKVGKTWKKKFAAAMMAGFLGLASLIAIFGFSGTIVALPLGGIGDFIVEFDELKGENFQLLPNIGETGNSDAAPMVRNKMDSATITGLHIYKDLKLPTGNWIRIHIHSEGQTTITGLIQDARFIDADLSFEELGIHEKNTEDYTQNWTQSASTVNIKNAKIVTDYLFQTTVSLQGAKISIESIDGPEIIEQ